MATLEEDVGRPRAGPRGERVLRRYTSIIGDGLRARRPAERGTEAVLRKVVRVSWSRQPPVPRRRPRVLTCTPMSSASTGNGRSAYSRSGRQCSSSREPPAASPARQPNPTSGTTRGTRRASTRTPPATDPARSGTHATCRAPRRHTGGIISAGRRDARGWRRGVLRSANL